MRFTTSDLNSGIHTETRRVRREGAANRKESLGSSKEKDAATAKRRCDAGAAGGAEMVHETSERVLEGL